MIFDHDGSPVRVLANLARHHVPHLGQPFWAVRIYRFDDRTTVNRWSFELWGEYGPAEVEHVINCVQDVSGIDMRGRA